MTIKILGTGCSNCKKLEKHAIEAVKELGLDISVEKIENIQDIMAYGVMSTPAIVVDEEVKIMGRVPSVKEIKTLLI